MTGNVTNVAASVHRRLLNKASQSRRPFNELLQHFAIERFIYRLSKSRHADRFVLKGALMSFVWKGYSSRPTRDIDLLGRIDNSLERILAVMKDACAIEVEPDGMSFDGEAIRAIRITEDAEYEGVRVVIPAILGNARISLQIDIGFGDVVVPGASMVSYPTLLDFPAPVLNGYTMESAIAEKFQTMAKLGVINSRMKDFYDIWQLSRSFDFRGEMLARAVAETFDRRDTLVAQGATIFEASFVGDSNKQAQWRAFVGNAVLDDAPDAFGDVVATIRLFLEPIVISLSEGRPFCGRWNAPGPWC